MQFFAVWNLYTVTARECPNCPYCIVAKLFSSGNELFGTCFPMKHVLLAWKFVGLFCYETVYNKSYGMFRKLQATRKWRFFKTKSANWKAYVELYRKRDENMEMKKLLVRCSSINSFLFFIIITLTI